MPRANRIAEWIAKRGMRYPSRNRGKSWAVGCKDFCWNDGALFALLADGLESGADVLSGHVVCSVLKITVKPRDADHPYGDAKLNRLQRCAWASRSSPAAVTIMVESIHEILTTHRLPGTYPRHIPWSCSPVC